MGTPIPTRFTLGIQVDSTGTFSKALNTAKSTDIASAATTDLGAAIGNYIQVTGTTTITGLGTIGAGVIRFVTFTGILTLTYAASLILPTGASIITATGDTATFISEGAGNWRCITYLRATGSALVGSAAGDLSSNTSVSVDSELVIFNSTTGKSVKRGNLLSGFTFLTAGVVTAIASVGTGSVVLATNATLITPVLGVASATTINKVTLTAPATGSTLTIADGKILSANNTLTLSGTDGSTVAFGTGGTVLYNGGALGTPSSATLTNATGLPISTGVSGLAANVATFLGTPSSANLAAALTDKTGTGSAVFANSPVFTTPTIGAAIATSINLAQGQNSSATLVTSATTADQPAVVLSSTVYRAFEFVVVATSGTSYHIFKGVIIHDGTSASHTVLADIYTGASLTTVNSDVNTGNVRLLVTPTNAVTTYKVIYRALNI